MWSRPHGFQPLSVKVSPTSYVQVLTNGDSPHTSSPFVATVSGGNPAYSYAWSWVGAGTGLTINTPSASTTTITATGSDVERSDTLRCTVTDTLGNASADSSVSITFGTP